ncbi:MAG: hypothetical protein EBS17_06870 [Flavobacteriia bacterium]|nr:hypothetical protein [Flavobacteriia bacterium]
MNFIVGSYFHEKNRIPSVHRVGNPTYCQSAAIGGRNELLHFFIPAVIDINRTIVPIKIRIKPA